MWAEEEFKPGYKVTGDKSPILIYEDVVPGIDPVLDPVQLPVNCNPKTPGSLRFTLCMLNELLTTG
jgi:hypothetical protein